MAVTDLTGTKWLFNSSLNVPEYFDGSPFSVNFVSNDVSYSRIRFEILMNTIMYYGVTNASEISVYSDNWTNEAYRTIEITGGTDTTNATLISWLEANATQIVEPVITDLTGTKWLMNEVPEEFYTRSILGLKGVTSVTGFGFTAIKRVPASGITSMVTFSDGGQNSSASVFYGTGSTYNGWYSKTTGTSEATFSPLANPPTIKITGGAQVTNADLIAWFQNNATQIHAGKFSFGGLPISDMYFGTKKVIKAYFGNSLVWERETPVPENALLAQDGKLFANGGGYLITTEVTLITFKVDSIPYQAESGMAWQEWCASEYNTNGYKVIGGGIYTADNQYYVANVLPSDKIRPNGAYWYANTGGGSND